MSNVTVPDTAPNRDQRFEQLVDQYQESVLRTCYLYLCDKTLAEDATQDTFLKVYRTMDSFRGESSEKPESYLKDSHPEPISYFANAMFFIFECSFSCRPARSSEKVAEWKTGTEVYVFSHPKGWYEIEYDGIHRL